MNQFQYFDIGYIDFKVLVIRNYLKTKEASNYIFTNPNKVKSRSRIRSKLRKLRSKIKKIYYYENDNYY